MPVEIFENCAIFPLQVRSDERGDLVAIEGNSDIPFKIARVYYLFGTKPGAQRGFHAHRALNQVAVCLSGSCTIVMDNGTNRLQLQLSRPDEALHLGAMVWHEMRDFSEDCVLLVLADAPYDEEDYIRDYGCFLAELAIRA
jgi:dTDP-4-dehydrorhamnose 3,5-epimerase-like enzyme